MTGRTPDLQRFSPLSQINKTNVKNLVAAWTFSTGVLNGHEGNPLVIGNVMYVHSAFPNIVYALDLTKEGAPMIWKHVPSQPTEATPNAAYDLSNRGLAYHPSGKLFIELLAGDLLALDAKTGKQLWRVPNADYRTGSTMTNAPIVIKDIVIAGISGDEFGVRGRVTAYNVNSGKELWRAYSTGSDAAVRIVGDANPNYPSMRGKDLGVSTWQGDEWQHGGGSTSGWYSYDPQLNLFYYSTGNPGTWNADQRPGANKWSATIFARNPDNGQARWAYQLTPHNEWAYAGINENVLVDLTIGGKPVKALVHFDRNGFAYTLDRTNGKVLVAEPYGPVNWASRVDLTTGTPVRNPQFGTTSTRNTEGICPAAIGFKDQQPSAYSPRTKLFYVPTNNVCMDYEGVDVRYSAGQPFVGAIVRMYPGPGGNRGRFLAWDPTVGKAKWEIKENLAAYGGALATAGGLVFYGTMEGWLKAVDAETGQELWKFKTPSGIVGNPMTYLGPDGKQYIAVLSGIGGWAGIGVSRGISPDDPTAALGAIGAFGDYINMSNAGGNLLTFRMPEHGGAAYADIVFSSDPQGLYVYMNGERNYRAIGSDGKTYRLQAGVPHRFTWKDKLANIACVDTVLIDEGAWLKVKCTTRTGRVDLWEPTDTLGAELELNSEPEGLEVYLDDQVTLIAHTPYTVKRPAGRHVFFWKRESAVVCTDSITLKNGHSLEVRCDSATSRVSVQVKKEP